MKSSSRVFWFERVALVVLWVVYGIWVNSVSHYLPWYMIPSIVLGSWLLGKGIIRIIDRKPTRKEVQE